MAFDQTTRNRLNRFVADSRGVLATEFTRQLQATYGMNPVTGDVADINSLAGLTPHQQETAQLLRDTFEHYLAANDHAKGKSKEKENRLAALDRIVREQAFTVLNRLAALRMSEAREFLTESLANGYDSKGFQLFHRIAGTSLGETGEAYTHYLFSIFDEFALDLSVLFDRFAAQGRLFPSTPVLLELLALINDDEVAPLWEEDETIGWIYQYFNSQEERKKMRDASQAPRNSRELAVRNQFFTPRYVVEFLTDNTLGRIWYEMTKGQTKLISECEYLVKRPNEIFLNQGEQALELDSTEGLSQEELLQQTVYIEHRVLKDPRDIKMLDPACGSMHFGLYCFDLFERIYEEAWDIELAQGAECFVRENNQASLTQTYSDKAEFLTHVPRLIIENNIHGVDIDPRAAQVAGMSLWQRAHNSWQKSSVKPQLRPQITKSNIVCAEPMPGEKELLQEFSSQLKPTVLGQLVEVIFEKMQLAGEAGTLLKIEKEIEDAIAGAKEVWQQQNQALSQFPDLAKVAKQRGDVDFDVSDIDDDGFWNQAEQKILDALASYASSTSVDMNEQKRLFASDAAKGFAFIDLCKKRFDVVLMNPPFGESPSLVKSYLKKQYDSGRPDAYMCFIKRSSEMLKISGIHGSITSKTFLTLKFFDNLRESLLEDEFKVKAIVDLGSGVLDGATVDTCCLISEKGANSKAFSIFDLTSIEDKELSLSHSLDNLGSSSIHFLRTIEQIKSTPGAVFAYKIQEDILNTFKVYPPLDSVYAMQLSPSDSFLESNVRQGLIPGNQFRFTRNWNELDKSDSDWVWCSKGGDFSRWLSKEDNKINWKKNGREIKAFAQANYGSASRTIKNEHFYFQLGITFPRVSSVGLNARLLCKNSLFSDTGMALIPSDEENVLGLLGYLNSSFANYLCDSLHPGRKFEVAHISSLPEPRELVQDNKFKDLVFKSIKSEYIQSLRNPFLYSYISPFISNLQSINYENELNSYVLDFFNVSLKSRKEIQSNVEEIASFEQKKLDKLRLFYIESVKNSKEFKDVIVDYFLQLKMGLRHFCSQIELDELVNKIESSTEISQLVDLVCEDNRTRFGSSISTTLPILSISNCYEYFVDFTSLVQSNFGFGVKKEISYSREEFDDLITNPNRVFSFVMNRTNKAGRLSPDLLLLQSVDRSFGFWIRCVDVNKDYIFEYIVSELEPRIKELRKEIDFRISENQIRESEQLKELVKEGEDFKLELINILKFWCPNKFDGTLVSFSPFHKLVRLSKLKSKLLESWSKLNDGEYDWAHLAFSIWPERVLKKCHEDRSLAIAHAVEDDLWHEVEVIKGRKKEPVWEWQPKPLSDAELRAYIKERIATDERLKLYRSNQSDNANGGVL